VISIQRIADDQERAKRIERTIERLRWGRILEGPDDEAWT
jgi:hypothetical protein